MIEYAGTDAEAREADEKLWRARLNIGEQRAQAAARRRKLLTIVGALILGIAYAASEYWRG